MKNKRARARKNVAAAHATRDFPSRTDDFQRYARVTKTLGDGRLTAACDDGFERLCKIRGKMRGREWINVGDLVLVSVREFERDKADVVWRYKPQEESTLRRWGELATLVDVGGGGDATTRRDDDLVGDVDGVGTDVVALEDVIAFEDI